MICADEQRDYTGQKNQPLSSANHWSHSWVGDWVFGAIKPIPNYTTTLVALGNAAKWIEARTLQTNIVVVIVGFLFEPLFMRFGSFSR